MAVSVVNKVTSQNSTGNTSYSTGSFTPSSNKLLIACVTSRTASGDPSTPTLSGNGLTWVSVLSINYDNSGSQKRLTIFRAMGASPSAGALTASFSGQTQTDCVMVVDEFTGMDTSGTNGSGAIVQTASNTNTVGGTSITATLSAFSSTGNATYGVAAIGIGTGTSTAGTGFTKVGENATASNLRLVTEFRSDNDTTVDISSNTSAELGIIGVEIKASSTTAQSTAGIIATLEKPTNSTVATLTTLEKQNATSTVSTLTTLEKPQQSSTVSVQSTLELIGTTTSAIKATLEKTQPSTVAVQSNLEPVNVSTTALSTTLERVTASTTALSTLLEAPVSSSTSALSATLEKTTRSTVALIATLEKTQKSTTALTTSLLTATPLSIKIGSFTGNALNNRAITGVGFQPDLVLIKNVSTNTDTWFRTKDMSGDFSLPIRSDAASSAGRIISLDSNGFTVGSDSSVNGNTNTIVYYAVKSNGGGDFATFTYTGDATDDKLVFTDFQPTYAMIKSNSAIVGAEKFAGQASATGNQSSNIASMNYGGGADRTDLIYFGTDGVRVSNGSNSSPSGNLINVNAVTHYGFCFKDRTGYVKAGSYTGNGTNNNAPVSLGFQPGVVLIKGSGSTTNCMTLSSMSAGNSFGYDGTQTTGNINSLTSTGFTLGTGGDTNTNAATYWYMALADPSYVFNYSTTGISTTLEKATVLSTSAVKTTLETPETRTAGYSMRFPGKANSNISVASATALNPTSAISVEAWVLALDSSWTTNNRRILQKGAADNQYRLLAEDGVLKWGVYTTVERTITATLPSSGAWHHILATYNATTGAQKLYVDGSLVASATQTVANINTTTDALAIGTKTASPVDGDAFYGLLDEVRIYSKEVSGSEATAHYNSGRGQLGVAETNLVAGYHFDDQATSATDYSGNTLTGTINGTLVYTTGIVPITPTTIALSATLEKTTQSTVGLTTDLQPPATTARSTTALITTLEAVSTRQQSLVSTVNATNLDGFDASGIWSSTGDGSNNNYINNNSDVGVIIPSITIPQGATIVSAYLRVYGFGDGSNTRNIAVKGFAEDNASAFASDGSNKPSTRTKTSASVTWSQTFPFAFGFYTSPDIGSILQEVVNRSGWSSGNQFGLALEHTGTEVGAYLAIRDYTASSANAPRLTVTYIPSGATTAVNTDLIYGSVASSSTPLLSTLEKPRRSTTAASSTLEVKGSHYLALESLATAPTGGSLKNAATYVSSGGGYVQLNTASSNTTGQIEYTGTLRRVPHRNWKILVLIYQNIDFSYTDSGSVARHVQTTMTSAEMIRAAAAATNFVNTDIPALSSGNMQGEITIRYPSTLTSLSTIASSYWPSYTDTSASTDSSNFDACIVIWKSNGTDINTGDTIELSGYAGLTVGGWAIQTYTAIPVASVTPLAGDPTQEAERNVFKHEFGHAITGYYDYIGLSPSPVVDNHHPEDYVHLGTTNGYILSDETLASPIPNSIYNNDSGFTHDYYSGTIALATDIGTILGITPTTWAGGGPVSKPVIQFDVQFDLWAGGGSGADATYFYWGCKTTPTQEDNNGGGYAVAFSEYSSTIKLYYQGVSVTSVSQSGIANSTWHSVRITVQGTRVRVYFDGVLKIDYTDTARTVTGDLYGWGGRSGAVTNEHRVRNISYALQGTTTAVSTTLEKNTGATTALLTTLEVPATRSTLALRTTLESLGRSGAALQTALEANKLSTVAITTQLDIGMQYSTTALSTALEALRVSTVATLTTLEHAAIGSTVALLSSLEKPQGTTVALIATLEKTSQKTVAMGATLERQTGSTSAVATILEKTRQSTVGVNATLENGTQYSTSALLTTLEKTTQKTVAIGVTLEHVPVVRTVAVITTLQTPLTNASCAVLTTLEKGTPQTLALSTTLERLVIGTFAVSSSLERRILQTVAVLTTLEVPVAVQTIAVTTTLSKPQTQCLAILTIFESHATTSTTAIATSLVVSLSPQTIQIIRFNPATIVPRHRDGATRLRFKDRSIKNRVL